jgi:hypothetical protein
MESQNPQGKGSAVTLQEAGALSLDRLAAAMGLIQGTPQHARLSRDFTHLEAWFAQDVTPAARWRFAQPAPPGFPPLLARCPKVALCVVTAGPAATARIARLSQQGRRFTAWALDVAANLALENQSDQVRDDIGRQAHAEGLKLTRRFSPGCPHMAMDCQRQILESLPAAGQIGVGITPAGMLTPVKSATFAYGAADFLDADQPPDHCGTCRRLGCDRNPARRRATASGIQPSREQGR